MVQMKGINTIVIITFTLILIQATIISSKSYDLGEWNVGESLESNYDIYEIYEFDTPDAFFVTRFSDWKKTNMENCIRWASKSTRKFNVWDYILYYNDSNIPVKTIHFLEIRYEDNKTKTDAVCFNVTSDTKTKETFYLGNWTKPIIDGFWYPFDTYNFSYSIDNRSKTYSYGSQLLFPDYLIPDISNNSIQTVLIEGKSIIMTSGNISKKIAEIFIIGSLIRPSLNYGKIVLIPPIIVKDTKVQINILITRSDILKYIFLVSLVAILLIIFNGARYNNPMIILRDGFLIWVFQEGISQLIPTVRPMSITLFDITILIVILSSLTCYLVNKMLKLKELQS